MQQHGRGSWYDCKQASVLQSMTNDFTWIFHSNCSKNNEKKCDFPEKEDSTKPWSKWRKNRENQKMFFPNISQEQHIFIPNHPVHWCHDDASSAIVSVDGDAVKGAAPASPQRPHSRPGSHFVEFFWTGAGAAPRGWLDRSRQPAQSESRSRLVFLEFDDFLASEFAPSYPPVCTPPRAAHPPTFPPHRRALTPALDAACGNHAAPLFSDAVTRESARIHPRHRSPLRVALRAQPRSPPHPATGSPTNSFSPSPKYQRTKKPNDKLKNKNQKIKKNKNKKF